jgi:serine/threonine protein kinase
MLDGALPALVAVLAVLAVLLVVFTVLYFIFKKRREVDTDSPDWQIQMLKRRTRDFGVSYGEMKFGGLLGKGSQGEVFKAWWNGTVVAVKKVDTRKVDPDIVEEFCHEAEIMRRLRHPCLTLFMGVSLEHPHLCIVTEFVVRGSLFDILHDENAGYTWSKALQIALDVAAGVSYLHGHIPSILHRDLKSLNILITKDWRAKVADFGMTRFQEAEGAMTQCGS